MSKPGEMIQILRENYEEQLEAYRLLRNKFLIAVPGMDLDKEKQLYDQWKLDLHLNSIISFDRSPQRSADVETVREALDSLRGWIPEQTEDDCMGKVDRALAALDRTAGKEE